MILCNITYDIVTHESAEDGDVAESGFISEDEVFGFRELVEWMKGGEPSSWPNPGSHDWVSQDQGETRAYFEDGERETRSIHFSRKNPEYKRKYWVKALRAAGLRRD